MSNLNLPYVTSPGNISKALQAIKTAAVPEKVNQDFVKVILKIPGGSGDQMTSFLKKIGFVKSDGSPSPLYTKFRNPTTSGEAVALAIRQAYAPLYIRNEYMHALSDSELQGLIVEETGLAPDSNSVKLTLSALKSLKQFAAFEQLKASEAALMVHPEGADDMPKIGKPKYGSDSFGLNLGYTININLPATAEQAVYNAIFKSIKQNLLSSDDA